MTRFADKLATDVAGYQWLVVVTFVLLVPMAFCVCTALTIWQSRRQEQQDAEMEQPLLDSTMRDEPEPEIAPDAGRGNISLDAAPDGQAPEAHAPAPAPAPAPTPAPAPVI
eukprot:COSAG01_NODE_6052_length_3878_cov_97.784334_2_plen_111_part_00